MSWVKTLYGEEKVEDNVRSCPLCGEQMQMYSSYDVRKYYRNRVVRIFCESCGCRFEVEATITKYPKTVPEVRMRLVFPSEMVKYGIERD